MMTKPIIYDILIFIHIINHHIISKHSVINQMVYEIEIDVNDLI